VKRHGTQSAALLVVLTLVAAHLQAQQSRSAAAVSGIVRNAEGTPQMGAMVQLVAAHANPSAFAALGTAVSAFTDIHGRYLIRNVPPGRYQLRATAALFMPALHDNLQLHAGAQAVVNVTLNTLFEAARTNRTMTGSGRCVRPPTGPSCAGLRTTVHWCWLRRARRRKTNPPPRPTLP
jgi:hypothetical protein